MIGTGSGIEVTTQLKKEGTSVAVEIGVLSVSSVSIEIVFSLEVGPMALPGELGVFSPAVAGSSLFKFMSSDSHFGDSLSSELGNL